MPELPEVETARRLIADQALHRRIVAVDDADTFVCRPHSPGELRDALAGRTLTAAKRRGKTMWLETSGVGGSAEPGPDLGIHLGMGGRIVVTGPDGSAQEGGGPRRRDAQPRKAEQARIPPALPVNRLPGKDIDRLYRALQAALKSAGAKGGVHTGDVIEARHPGGTCPRCGAEMVHGTVGGRSTWWCSREQAAWPDAA